jgi:hypothetical protein
VLVSAFVVVGHLLQQVPTEAVPAVPEGIEQPAEPVPVVPAVPTVVETAPPVTSPVPINAKTPSVPVARRRFAQTPSGARIEGARDGVPDCRANAAFCIQNEFFAFWPRARLRTGYSYIQPDSQLAFVGRNDGFTLDQNRFGFDAAYKDWTRFRLIVDVVTILPGAPANQPVNPVLAAVRDAWVSFLPSPWLTVTVGQQFMPADLEGSTTIATLPFAGRSVAAVGVAAGQGYAVGGLSPARQTGVVVASEEGLLTDDVAVNYAVGVSNGNGQNVLGNDNKLPAAYLRLGVDVGERFSGHVGGRYNPRTVGTAPNLFDETDALGFADVQANYAGFEFAASAMARSTSFATLVPVGGGGLATDVALGGTAWLAIRDPLGVHLWGLVPALRASYYDPSSQFADDQLVETTLAVRYDAPVEHLGVALIVEGTVLTEIGDGVRDLDNARLQTLLQLDL